VVKIVDVARAAGVSPATVSRALNNYPTVGPEYVKRVRAAAVELGYRPNSVARNLRRQKTDLLALIIPDVSNFFCTLITRGVEDVARAAGISVLLCNSDEDRAKEAKYLAVAEQERVAGVILSPHDESADISLLAAAGIPVVAIDRPLGARIDYVASDSYAGAVEATQHLLDQGWQRPGCCGGPEDVETARRRVAGYRAALKDSGVEPRVAIGAYDQEGGARAAGALLDRDDPPDALLVSNERMALGVLSELSTRGIRPGVDIGVLTFDDTPWAPLMTPPMTVIEQPAYEIGARAAQILIDRIRNGPDFEVRHVELPTRLIVRRSSLRQGHENITFHAFP